MNYIKSWFTSAPEETLDSEEDVEPEIPVSKSTPTKTGKDRTQSITLEESQNINLVQDILKKYDDKRKEKMDMRK